MQKIYKAIHLPSKVNKENTICGIWCVYVCVCVSKWITTKQSINQVLQTAEEMRKFLRMRENLLKS